MKIGRMIEISAKEFCGKPGRILAQAARGTEVVITMHGKKMARLIPYEESTKKDRTDNNMDDDIFGLWKEHDGFISADHIVRTIRKRRAL
jgi:prevent-host-death family protein